MAYGVIYQIRCLINGKCYHGQTVNPAERWLHHLRKDSHCHALRSALAKYGPPNFSFEVVAEANSKDELDVLEIKWVATSISPIGYNLKTGGANGRPSAETRRKLSVASKVAQNRPEVKAKNSEGVKRAMARPDVKAKIQAIRKKTFGRPEMREMTRVRMIALHARPGDKEKRGKAIHDSWANYSKEEHEQRILRQKMGYTKEVRQHISNKAREVQARPEVKEKHRASIRASMTPERRVAMGDRMREVHSRPGEKERRGKAISEAHNTPEGKKKLARRRRVRETVEAWRARIEESER